MTLEMGKTVAEARGEVTYGAEFFRWFAEEAVRVHGRYSVAPNGASRLLTMKQPVGPTLMITPWNFPLAMGTCKIGPAIAAGCTMVVKPAHETPLTMLLLAQVLQEAGAARRGPQRHHDDPLGAVCEPADPRRTPASSPSPAPPPSARSRRAVGRAAAARLDGARGQRAVPRLRGRRRRPGRRRGDARQDAQHRRGVHRREPLLRPRVPRRGVLDQARRADGRARRRQGHEEGRRRRPLITPKAREKVDELVQDAVDKGARLLTGGKALPGRATSTSRPCSPTCPPTAAASARRSSARWRRSPRSPTTRDAVAKANAPSTAWSATSTPTTRPGCSGSRRRWSSGWSASTPASCPTRRHRSGGCQAVRLRPGGRLRGHRRVPRDQVRRHRAVTSGGDAPGTRICRTRRTAPLPDGGLSSMSTSTDTPRVRTTMDRRRSVSALLEATDEALKRGARPAPRRSGPPARPARLHLDGGLRSASSSSSEAARAPARRRWPCRWCATRSGPGGTRSSSPSSTTRRPSSSGSSRSRPPRQPSRQGSTPPPRATSTRCARSSRPRTPTGAGSRTPWRTSPTAADAFLSVQEYAPRLHIHESNQQTDPDEVAGVLAAACRTRPASLLVLDYSRRCRSRTTSATRPRGSRSSPRRSRTCP